MMRWFIPTISALFLCGLPAPALAADAPVAVSPGHASSLALIEGRCPTFSWGAREVAEQYELAVYRLEGEEEKPVLRLRLPGAVTSWTPSIDSCLESGGRYAWSVRAVHAGVTGGWSAPRLFEVMAGPTPMELETALRIVREHFGDSGVGDPEPERERVASPTTAGEPLSGQPFAPPGTALEVAGNVHAVSFSGDGSMLSSLSPANLSAAVSVAQGGTGATNPADARSNLDVAQGAHTVDTNADTKCRAGTFLNGDGTCDSYLGVNDTAQGSLSLFGDDSGEGGFLELFNAAKEDGTTDSWWVLANDGLQFLADGSSTVAELTEESGSRFSLGSSSDGRAAIEGDLESRSVNGYLGVEGGDMETFLLSGFSIGAMGLPGWRATWTASSRASSIGT